MNEYYSKKLSANLLKRCYDIAPKRVQRYLESELSYVLEHIVNSDIVLELGCGYGRVLNKLLPNSAEAIGIDTSRESLELATEYNPRCHLIQASAEKLPFLENSVGKVVCIQNGISAFKVNPLELIQESIRVTKSGGTCLYSSYSEKFWDHRLDWFRIQADAGLIGEIDWKKTSDGIIVCKDGFTATTFTSEDFEDLVIQMGLDATIIEIDESSIFCKMNV
ncbi:MAG: class I SAM-dependent methyltransferase [Candidatus Thorarchaeota archaeon]